MAYEIDKKTKGRIISGLRRISRFYPPSVECKRKKKVDKALYQCSKCEKYCYEGKSLKNLDELRGKHFDKVIVMEKVQVDHKSPMIPIEKDWIFDWNDVIRNLFCDIKGLQLLCSSCHDEKTNRERTKRAKLRKSKKT